MKRLTLLRHAKSSWGRPDIADHDRPLNARGERDAPLMGRRLIASGARPSLIVTSPATRARQTTKLFAREIGYPIEFIQTETSLYLADPQTILEVIEVQDAGAHEALPEEGGPVVGAGGEVGVGSRRP